MHGEDANLTALHLEGGLYRRFLAYADRQDGNVLHRQASPERHAATPYAHRLVAMRVELVQTGERLTPFGRHFHHGDGIGPLALDEVRDPREIVVRVEHVD